MGMWYFELGQNWELWGIHWEKEAPKAKEPRTILCPICEPSLRAYSSKARQVPMVNEVNPMAKAILQTKII
eukprot:7646627-Karenia_brevis.AAC.1